MWQTWWPVGRACHVAGWHVCAGIERPEYFRAGAGISRRCRSPSICCAILLLPKAEELMWTARVTAGPCCALFADQQHQAVFWNEYIAIRTPENALCRARTECGGEWIPRDLHIDPMYLLQKKVLLCAEGEGGHTRRNNLAGKPALRFILAPGGVCAQPVARCQRAADGTPAGETPPEVWPFRAAGNKPFAG